MLNNNDPKYVIAVVLDIAMAEKIEYTIGLQVYSTIMRIVNTATHKRMRM